MIDMIKDGLMIIILIALLALAALHKERIDKLEAQLSRLGFDKVTLSGRPLQLCSIFVTDNPDQPIYIEACMGKEGAP